MFVKTVVPGWGILIKDILLPDTFLSERRPITNLLESKWDILFKFVNWFIMSLILELLSNSLLIISIPNNTASPWGI